ncbi:MULTISPECIES: LysR family transcriptional regulator [Glycomyces]|uniref:DNA-binding transcriptional LysR family regulator n=2 Tax=Glycomyces TaxID=58113 RepID=A0A9X3SW89_9ACTN|nr:LysR family transcriptional regulator [Glycomyces lechevalierae]MDA1387540.1 LysR family transcriptional regulator [Glycomyces lechevalierae]MDR7336694.1 DNA-binding transcriptional LysR family regulator [Glycomyces lechevalierae]
MRIEQLEYVAAVTRYGSLRRASEHLHVSQPALSEAISKLERELGVTLLERRREGARITLRGKELLEHMMGVLEAVDRLQSAAGVPGAASSAIRVGTVNAGTASLLLPAIRDFHRDRTGARVEVRALQQGEIEAGLADGSLDLGLVNALDDFAVPTRLDGAVLREGRPVAVLPGAHQLASQAEVSAADLRAEPFVGMRSGYVMHRFALLLFEGRLPTAWHSVDGAEMGKMLVAEGLGATILPDYSVHGDPLERSGLITVRPIKDDRTRVTMWLLRRRGGRPPAVVDDLVARFRARSAAAGTWR